MLWVKKDQNIYDKLYIEDYSKLLLQIKEYLNNFLKSARELWVLKIKKLNKTNNYYQKGSLIS